MSNTEFPQPPHAPHPIPPVSGSNGLATAGFVLSLLGLLGSWIPFLNFLGILLAVIGIILAGIGLAKAKSAGAGKGLAIAGVIVGVLAVVIAIIINAAFVDAVDEAFDETLESSQSTGQAGSSDESDEDEKGDSESTFVDGVLTTSDVKIEITDHRVIAVGQKGNEYGDKPIIAFWYKITNVSGDDVDPMEWLYLITAYQDNDPNAVNEIEVSSLPDDRFLETQLETIKKGGTVENAMAYELDDEVTPVELVASEMFEDEFGRTIYKLK